MDPAEGYLLANIIVIELRLEVLLESPDVSPVFFPALTELYYATQKCAGLIDMMINGELSACEECGCTVEDGECECSSSHL